MAMIDKLVGELTATDEGMRDFQRERITLDISERVCELMLERGISRAELAKRLRVTKGRVTRLLSGNANMTLHTLSDAYFALGRAVEISDCVISKSLLEAPCVFELEYAPSSPKVKWTTPSPPTEPAVA